MVILKTMEERLVVLIFQIRVILFRMVNIISSDADTGSVGSGMAHSHSLSASFSGSSVTPTGTTSINAVSTLQPYVAIKFMIKT